MNVCVICGVSIPAEVSMCWRHWRHNSPNATLPLYAKSDNGGPDYWCHTWRHWHKNFTEAVNCIYATMRGQTNEAFEAGAKAWNDDVEGRGIPESVVSTVEALRGDPWQYKDGASLKSEAALRQEVPAPEQEAHEPSLVDFLNAVLDYPITYAAPTMTIDIKNPKGELLYTATIRK